MKLSVIALFSALAASSVEGFAFMPQSGYVARNTALNMAVEDNEVKEVKVGVIGCGRIGIVHLGAITKAPNVKPIIVSNPTVAKAEAGENEKPLIELKNEYMVKAYPIASLSEREARYLEGEVFRRNIPSIDYEL